MTALVTWIPYLQLYSCCICYAQFLLSNHEIPLWHDYVCSKEAPFLASWSAISLPGSPRWARTWTHITPPLLELHCRSSSCHKSLCLTSVPAAVFQPLSFQPAVQDWTPLMTYLWGKSTRWSEDDAKTFTCYLSVSLTSFRESRP